MKFGHNFATPREILVARATMLVAFATVLAAVSSPDIALDVSYLSVC